MKSVYEVEDIIESLYESVYEFGCVENIKELVHWENQLAKYEVYNENGWEYEFEDYKE